MLHKDPFDRLLLAQARAEGILLLTAELIGAAKEYPVVTGDLAKNFFLRGQE